MTTNSFLVAHSLIKTASIQPQTLKVLTRWKWSQASYSLNFWNLLKLTTDTTLPAHCLCCLWTRADFRLYSWVPSLDQMNGLDSYFLIDVFLLLSLFFCSLPFCQSRSASTLFLLLGASWQTGSVEGCCWYNQFCSKKDICSTSHLFLKGKVNWDWLGAACTWPSLSGGKTNIYLNVCPPCVSSFSLTELWHWRCLPIWLSLSVTSHCSCFSGFASSEASDWYMKPKIASTTSPGGSLFHP